MGKRSHHDGSTRRLTGRTFTSFLSLLLLFSFVLGQAGTIAASAGAPSLTMGQAAGPSAPAVLDAGAISLDFIAAGPFTYSHITGLGGAFNDRTISKTTGVVESLEGGDFACGDKVVFFTQIVADPGAGSGSVDLSYTYDGETTSGAKVGFDDILSASINSPDTGNQNLTGNESASIQSESFITAGKDRLETTVRVNGVDGGEHIILRMVVELYCAPNPGNVTGNIQSALDGATVVGGKSINSGQQTIPLKQAGNILLPGLNVTKSCPAEATVGDTITYSITVSNTGQDTLTNLVVNDPLLGGNLAGFGTTLAASASVAKTFTYTLGANPDPVTNTVTASATGQSSNASVSDSAECVTDVLFPGLAIDKTADQGTVSAGDPIGFTITVTNNGPGAAKGVTLNDTLPSTTGLNWIIAGGTGAGQCAIGSGALTCSFGDMAASATKTVHITSSTTRLSCAVIDNTATADATNTDPVSDGASVTVQCPNLSIRKVADSASVSAGDPIGYTITVSNAGPGTAKGVVMTDTLPTNAGLSWTFDGVTGGWSCSIATGVLTCGGPNFNLAGSSSASVHIQSPTTKETCGQVLNTASVSATNNLTVQTGQVSIVVECASLIITKIADDSSVNAGDDIGYTITLTNNGAGTAKAVHVSDTLPANDGLSWSIDGGTGAAQCAIASGSLTCSFGDMAPGATKTIHITSQTTSASCGIVSNSASATSSNDGNPSAGPVTITVNCPDVSVLKTADQGTINAGDMAAFTIVVTNHGDGTAYGVTLDDPLPAGVQWAEDSTSCTVSNGRLTCQFGDLAPGASRTVHVSGRTDAQTCGVLTNTATVDATNEKNVPAATDDNSSTATITVECPDVSVLKTADQGTINAGDTAAYTVVVTNHGDGTARDVTLTDTLPVGVQWTEDSASCAIANGVMTCDFGDLAAGATRTVHVSGLTDAQDCGQLVNVATVSASNEADDDATDNQSEATITVNCPNVTVAKTADAGTISAGDTAAFTIVVSNTGAGTAYDATLTDTLPGGVVWTQDNEDCSIDAGILTCDFGDLAPEATRTIHVSGPTDQQDCGQIVNVATVSASNEADDDATDDQSEATITVDCPGIDIQKTADAEVVDAAELIGFTITVTNDGPGIARDVMVTDTLPANSGLAWTIDAIDGQAPGAEPPCSIADGVLTCSFGDMAVEDQHSVHISSDTDATSCGVVDNTATVTISNGDGDEDSASLTVNCPDLGIDIQKGGPDLAHVGDTITYTFDVQLTTPETLYDVTVSDPNCNEGAPVYVSGDDGDLALETGEVWSYTCTHLVTGTDPDPLPNTATVLGTADDGRTTTAQDDHSVDLIHPDIRIVKSVDPRQGNPGDTVTYSYKVTNTGDTTLYDISVDDDVIGHIGDIAQLEPGQTVTLTKDWVLPADEVLVTNVGTVTGTDVLGKSVSADDDANVTIVEANNPPIPPKPTAFTGSDALRLGGFAIALLALGLLALVATRRRRGTDA